jgi:hypothetical protein
METLAESFQQAMARERTHDWSMITVEPVGFDGKDLEFLGVAILDGRQRSDVHNGRSTVFRVESGEHTVSVHIKRRFRVAVYPGRAEVSMPVVVEPGENLHLVFGIENCWKPPPKTVAAASVILILACQAMALGVGWLAYPILHDAVAWTTRVLAIRQPWLSWCQFVVSSQTMTAAFCALAVAVAAQLIARRAVPEPTAPHRSPYFLAPRPAFGKPLVQFKEQYVDPFE